MMKSYVYELPERLDDCSTWWFHIMAIADSRIERGQQYETILDQIVYEFGLAYDGDRIHAPSEGQFLLMVLKYS